MLGVVITNDTSALRQKLMLLTLMPTSLASVRWVKPGLEAFGKLALQHFRLTFELSLEFAFNPATLDGQAFNACNVLHTR